MNADELRKLKSKKAMKKKSPTYKHRQKHMNSRLLFVFPYRARMLAIHRIFVFYQYVLRTTILTHLTHLTVSQLFVGNHDMPPRC